MFGGDNVLRFHKTRSGKKDRLKVQIYRRADILKSFPLLDREGPILFFVLCSGDYAGRLPRCRPVQALKVVQEGLGQPVISATRSLT